MTDYRQHRYSPSRAAVAPIALRPPLSPSWVLKQGSGRLVVGASGAITAVQGRRPQIVALDDAGRQRWAVDADPAALALTDVGLLANAERKGRPCLVLADAEAGRIHQEMAAEEGVVAALPEIFLTSSWNEPALLARSLDERMSVVWRHVYSIPGAEFRGLAAEQDRAVVTVLAGGEGHLVCLSMATGKEVWSRSLKEIDAEPSGHWDPATADGLLILSVAGGTAAVRMADGRTAWRSAASGIVTVYGGKVYVRGMNWRASGQPSQITVLGLKDGKDVWRRDYPEVLKKARGNRLAGYLGVSETHLFSGDDTGTIWAFDAGTGEPVWQHRSKQADAFAPWTIPVIARGRLYIASAGDKPHLLCYEPEGGAEVASRGSAERDAGHAEGLSFEIGAAHAKQKLTKARPYFASGGSSTVLECHLAGKAGFFLAVDEKSGQGYLWVAEAGEGEALLKAARKAFPARMTVGSASRVKPPTPLEVEVLGSGRGEAGSGRGTWTLSKWTGEDGAPEFYVNWSASDVRGTIIEKDEGQRKALLQLFASLVAR